jgi:hypothetical protein
MSNTPEQANLPTIRRVERTTTGAGRTPITAWVTVVLGGIILAENVLELGGVVPEAQELTAGFLAVLLLVHGVSLAWERGKVEDSAGLRLPRWPLAALPFVLWLGYGWWQDQQAPWVSRETFLLAAQAWLLCWVVAATPGGRGVSWAWLLAVAAVAGVTFVVAVGWQRGDRALWLPLGRELPEDWSGRWTGTLPTPGAFGGLMVLAGAPLLVMALSRRLGIEWRIGLGYAGLMLLFGALRSYALGAWLGVAFIAVFLPVVVCLTSGQRQAAWAGLLLLLTGFGLFLVLSSRFGAGGVNLFGWLQGGEPSLSSAWVVLKQAWARDIWCASRGLPFSELSLAAGAPGAGGGLNYGFSDWFDLAVAWGVVGLGLAWVALAWLLAAAWAGWAKLPFLVLPGVAAHGTSRRVRKHSPTQPSYTPETKILLGASALGLSAFVVTMLAARTLNIPAVTYAFAVVAGVIARNVPQRGGSLRLEPVVRWLAGLGPALIVAGWLVWIVAPVAIARYHLEQARHRLEQVAADPRLLQRDPAVLSDEVAKDLRRADAADPGSAPIWVQTAWLYFEQALLEPANFDVLSHQAEEVAQRAIQQAPEASVPRVTLGLAYLLDNRLSAAEAQLRQALELAPNDPSVQYYAVAVLALDPANRATARQLVDIVRAGNYPMAYVKQVQTAYAWGASSTIPLEGSYQRPLPPRYLPTRPEPPLEGLPRGTAAAASAAAAAAHPPKPPPPKQVMPVGEMPPGTMPGTTSGTAPAGP